MKKFARKGSENMMRLLIDANIIIDYLSNRMPFADHAEQLIEICAQGKADGILTASAVTDIYYVLHKNIDHKKIIDSLRILFSILNIAEVGKNDLLRAMQADMDDFEDALVAQCAKRVKAKYIVTRNAKHFAKSMVKPISPADFLNCFFAQR